MAYIDAMIYIYKLLQFIDTKSVKQSIDIYHLWIDMVHRQMLIII